MKKCIDICRCCTFERWDNNNLPYDSIVRNRSRASITHTNWHRQVPPTNHGNVEQLQIISSFSLCNSFTAANIAFVEWQCQLMIVCKMSIDSCFYCRLEAYAHSTISRALASTPIEWHALPMCITEQFTEKYSVSVGLF